MIVKVCIPASQRDYYDYDAGDLNLQIGIRVEVPFRKQVKIGIIVGYQPRSIVNKNALKTIIRTLDEKPLFDNKTLTLYQWVGQYYQSHLSEVLLLAIPKKIRQGNAATLPEDSFYSLSQPFEQAQALISKRAKKQQQLLAHIYQYPSIHQKQLINLKFTQGQLQTLIELGVIVCQKKPLVPIVESIEERPLILNQQQQQAFEAISTAQEFKVFLLQGVTGSGKTEVYLQTIAKLLTKNLQVLVVVPEIGLTPQLVERFKRRFAQPISVIHSHLNENERQIAWQLAKDKQISIVIGTRTAVFTPLPNLGLIIIDEEHDLSLKQMEGVRYSARDTALMRAYFNNCPIVLGSATPSLESLYNSQQGKYIKLEINQKALTNEPLHYQLIDLRNTVLEEGFSTVTISKIKQHLKDNNQVLIFINRRGYAPILICHHCAWIADCVACDSHLTLHYPDKRLICHHCGFVNPRLSHCAVCNQQELLAVGVGTQRVYQYVTQLFPEISSVRIDRDEMTKKNALTRELKAIKTGKTQLIVGTQMLAKGHHFPNLSLVVILNADAGFYNQDFRALEKLGQLLIQVSGRAGRAKSRGEIMVQTHLPDNPSLNLLIQQGYQAFAEHLLTLRQKAQLPPYSFMALIRAKDRKSAKALEFLHYIKQQLTDSGLELLGPAPAPLALKARLYRMQLLIKSHSRKNLQNQLTRLRQQLLQHKPGFTVKFSIDVDPQDLS